MERLLSKFVINEFLKKQKKIGFCTKSKSTMYFINITQLDIDKIYEEAKTFKSDIEQRFLKKTLLKILAEFEDLQLDANEKLLKNTRKWANKNM